MKIIVLHGEDTEKSYDRLQKFVDVARGRSWEITYLDESGSNLSDQLSAISLFGAERFFILKDIRRFTKAEFSWLNKNYKNLQGNLIIYHSGLLNSTFIRNLPTDRKVEEFAIPKLIWKFLDNINIKSFHEIIEKGAPEFIFAMIVWKFKKAYLAHPLEKTERIIEKLAELDYEVKTGRTDLITALDILIAKYL